MSLSQCVSVVSRNHSSRCLFVDGASPLQRQVAYVSSKTKESVRSLRKRATKRKTKDNVDRQVMVFKSLWWIYSHTSTGLRCEVLPGDLQATIDYRKSSAKSFAKCPALFVASLRGKEGPWHQCIQKAWQQYEKGSVRSGVPFSCLTVSDEDVACLLQSAARGMVHVNRAPWVANVGRNVSHHSGWLMFLMQKGLLVKRRCARGPDVLKFSGRSYKVAQVTKRILGKMSEMRRTGHVLLNMKTPRTIQEYRSIVKRATEQAPVSETKNKYTWPWLLRSSLISAMRLAHVNRLRAPANFLLKDLCNVFPDQKRHLKRFGKPSASISEVCHTLGYDGPLELLTYFLCTFCSTTVSGICPEHTHKNRSRLIRARESYQSQHGLAPHCAVLCAKTK